MESPTPPRCLGQPSAPGVRTLHFPPGRREPLPVCEGRLGCYPPTSQWWVLAYMMMFWNGRPWVQMVLLSIWVILCGGGGLPASTYTQSGPQPQECGRSTFLPGEEGRYQHVGGGQDSVHLPHTDDWVFISSRYMRWSMNGFLCGRRTPGLSLQPAQRSPAQECGRSTFLPGSGDWCRHARGGREGHPPTRTKINKKNFSSFFFLLYIIFFVYIYIYIISEHKHIYI